MHRRILTLVVSVLLALGLGAGPVAASTTDEPGATWYLALGDSYGAGYQPGTGVDLDGGYAGPVLDAFAELAPGARLENLSCPGERIGTLLDGGPHCSYEGSQIDAALAFLEEHPQTRLITLDIGGNDVQTCVDSATGGVDLACVQDGLTTIQTRLPGLLAQLREAAPDAQIVLSNYPDVFLAAWLRPSGESLARLSVTLVENLNGIYDRVATAAGVDFADVTEAFRTTDFDTMVDDPTYGEIPVNVAQVCSLTWMCSQGDIHPNDEGYAVIASVITEVLREPAAPPPSTATASPTSTPTMPMSTTTAPTPSTTSTDVAASSTPVGGPRTPALVQTDGSAPATEAVTALLALLAAAGLLTGIGAARRRGAARH